MSAIVGYARTSTADQTAGLADQVAKLQAAGCTKIFSEHVSGVDAKREELKAAMSYLRDGDAFIITKADRLARSTRDLLNIVGDLTERGVTVRILDIGVDTSTPNGKLMLTMLAAIAEFELAIMRERQRIGIADAKAAGRYKGRASTARAQAERVLELKAEGKRPADIVKAVKISRASYYRIIGESVT